MPIFQDVMPTLRRYAYVETLCLLLFVVTFISKDFSDIGCFNVSNHPQ